MKTKAQARAMMSSINAQAKVTKQAWYKASTATKAADKESKKLNKLIKSFPEEHLEQYGDKISKLIFP